MEVQPIGSLPSENGSTEWFTGTVRIDALFHAADPSRVSAASVTFEPGARTAWHTHPLRLGSALGRADRGGQAGGRRHDPCGREALARRSGDHRHDPHRHSGDP
jgi:hypothetical protein